MPRLRNYANSSLSRHHPSVILLASFVFGLMAAGALTAGSRNWNFPVGDYEQEPGVISILITSASAPLHITDDSGAPATGITSLDAVAIQYGVTELRKTFIMKESPKDPDATDLSRWYSVYFPTTLPPMTVVDAYQDCPEVEYAEPVPVQRACYTPNDPRLRSQWHLALCGFKEAWDVSKGSRDIVIGIVDSGIDMNYDGEENVHPDLMANLWVNPGEDLNGDGVIDWFEEYDGIDNDDNGFRDDFYGWDFTGRDNWPDDPWGTRNGHGTHVAGIASAVTDNDEGVAGAAFSCALMIAGCYYLANDSQMANTDQGIEYCAANGADVINLSYGRLPGGPIRSEQDAIEYALEEGVAVFAAAGNENDYDRRRNQRHYYPVAYDGVIGVGASDENDAKASFSNYGDYTDLVAPGEAILSTFPRGDYAALQGTSMASPLACGLGALILSVRPDMSADELLDWMQRYATDISEIGDNSDYPGIRYRINAGQALNATHPSLALRQYVFTDQPGDNDGRIEAGETISLGLTIRNDTNHVDAANATVALACADTFITIARGEADLGDIAEGDSAILTGDQRLRFTVQRGFKPHYSELTLIFNSDEEWLDTARIPITVGHPYYLMVDDDDSANYETHYETDLAVRPVVHDSWSVESDDLPLQSYLNEYSIVIWFTGNQRDPLSADKQELLTAYLSDGRALLLSGQYIGDDHGDEAFHQDVLHARHTGDNSDSLKLYGNADNPISDGVTLLLVGATDNGLDSPSAMEPVGGAEELMRYGTPGNPGDVGGIFYNGEDYRLVYLGFALEAVSGGHRTTTRREFIERTLDRLYELDAPAQETPAQPADYRLTVRPNPFNPLASVTVELARSGEYRLDVLDLTGRTLTVLHRGAFRAGRHNFEWNAGNAPAGIYLFRLSGSDGVRIQKGTLLK